MKDDMLDSIKDRLDSFEESAPEGLWSDIEASVFPKERARRPAFVPWLWLSAAAAAVAAVFVFINISETDPTEDRIAGQEAITPSSSSVYSGDNPAPSADQGVLLAQADVRKVRQAAVKQVEVDRTSAEPRLPDEAEPVRSEPEPTVQPEVSEPEPQEFPEPSEQDLKVAATHEGEDWSGYMSATDDGDVSLLSKVSLKASLTGAATESQDFSNYDPSMFYYGSGDTRSSGYPYDETRAPAPLPHLSTASPVSTESDHHRPVRMSLMLHMPLGKVFGLETGASYTLLRSTFTTSSGSTVSRDLQTLKYIGIPVNLTAGLFGNDWCRVYLSGGAMAEKCISGKIVNSKYVSGQLSGEKGVTDLTVKPLLWSLNAAAGAQVNLGGGIGLYAEPGLSYHFDDGSTVRTVYKDRPLDFMMTVGARVSFR
ncbi:MAG: hypothetical protein J6Z47_05520 [Bacteroidales bacterium]|nr:hypothetical protein [Bacteroidales bacterium]